MEPGERGGGVENETFKIESAKGGLRRARKTSPRGITISKDIIKQRLNGLAINLKRAGCKKLTGRERERERGGGGVETNFAKLGGNQNCR